MNETRRRRKKKLFSNTQDQWRIAWSKKVNRSFVNKNIFDCNNGMLTKFAKVTKKMPIQGNITFAWQYSC